MGNGRGPESRVRIDSTDKLNPDVASTVERGYDLPIAIGENPSVLEVSQAHQWEPEGARAIVDHAEYDAGDRVCAVIVPAGDPAVGTVTGAHGAGVDRVKVSATVLAVMRYGYAVKFAGHDTLYLVADIDVAASELVLDKVLESAVAGNEALHLRVPFVWNVRPRTGMIESFGDISPGATNIPAGAKLRIEYHHANVPTQNASAHVRLVYKF